MTILAPLALLGLLIGIPIILLYMLRLRRREVFISSNFLWQQVVQDTEANTPWQRLKRNLLLLLQLLILLLLVLALVRPAQIVPRIISGKTVILLDASASMRATDGEGGETRFEQARDEALSLAGELGPGDEMSVIRVGDESHILVEYTNSLTELRAAIGAAEPGSGGGDWETALTLAAAGAQDADLFTMVIITDGGIGEIGQLPENIPAPVIVPIGSSSDNIAVTALATRAEPGNAPQLFAQATNFGSSAAEVTMSIRLDGVLWESNTQTISARSQRAFNFPPIEQDFTTVQASLTFDDSVTDYLVLDNSAVNVASEARTRRVLLLSEADNIFLDQVLRSLPGVQTFRGNVNETTLPNQPYDFYIFDGWLPDVLPEADMLIINPPTSSSLFIHGEAVEDVGQITTLLPAHPLLTYVDIDTLNLRQYTRLGGLSWADTLVTVDDDPLLIAGDDRGRQVVILPFDLRDSDLSLRIAWPVLMANVVEWFTPANLVGVEDSVMVGTPLRISAPLGTTTVRVTSPGGDSTTLPAEEDEVLFADVNEPGIYTVDVLGADAVMQTQQVAVTLFGTNESDITPVSPAAITLGGGTIDQAAREEAQLGLDEFWPYLAALALLVLLIEWVVYHQRLRVPTVGQVVGRRLQRSTALR
ncbi:VWA domain-containing protein [Phototrophicus methaneseepsis]|uniref:VWA domain-containing protein n=1 Tax=Phototrophicus methaneseepsis TaxID=2710758 RepID=A0A7S8EA46_9CHLR|nr:VWA domain-containing protein [Phototrophicus methaneseepsis]QPC83184.1 VWA domain-containing protein [Phototrophicus methaneseepsis]